MSRNADVFTIGVEEEFQIIDPRTYALDAGVEHILPRAREKLGDDFLYFR